MPETTTTRLENTLYISTGTDDVFSKNIENIELMSGTFFSLGELNKVQHRFLQIFYDNRLSVNDTISFLMELEKNFLTITRRKIENYKETIGKEKRELLKLKNKSPELVRLKSNVPYREAYNKDFIDEVFKVIENQISVEISNKALSHLDCKYEDDRKRLCFFIKPTNLSKKENKPTSFVAVDLMNRLISEITLTEEYVDLNKTISKGINITNINYTESTLITGLIKLLSRSGIKL